MWLHARKFYEKNGFKPVKEATIDNPWGNKLTLVTYELELEIDKKQFRRITANDNEEE